MIKNNTIILLLFLLVGCAPSHSGWISRTNALVGSRFEPGTYGGCCDECANLYWSPVNRSVVFDRVTDEGESKRFYITWVRDCRYSILVSKDGFIKSWRYETVNTRNCYIF